MLLLVSPICVDVVVAVLVSVSDSVVVAVVDVQVDVNPDVADNEQARCPVKKDGRKMEEHEERKEEELGQDEDDAEMGPRRAGAVIRGLTRDDGVAVRGRGDINTGGGGTRVSADRGVGEGSDGDEEKLRSSGAGTADWCRCSI